MSRSRLQPYRADINEALAAGTSIRALARTYGVAFSTMQEFIQGYPNRHNPLRQCMYDTLRTSRSALVRAEHRQKELLP